MSLDPKSPGPLDPIVAWVVRRWILVVVWLAADSDDDSEAETDASGPILLACRTDRMR